MILGIDIGGTTTDLAGFDGDALVDVISVKASDPLASASGALGKFINKHNIPLSKIKKIAITGVGSSFIDMNLFGIETVKINEFTSSGLGGTYLVQADEAIVVSMGTGTAFVRVANGKVKHLGGTGVGGGTLMGLSKELLHTLDFKKVLEMSEKGDLGKVDLQLGDISQEEIGTLQKWITVSNFGKSSDDAAKEDLAAGIFNMVFQTIGMLSIFAARMEGDKNIIFTGQLANIPYGQRVLNSLIEAKLFDGNFKFPEYAEFSTAIGAAICLMKNNL